MTQILRTLKAFAVGAVGTQRAIPSLDGLRAISITFVLLAHLTGTRNFPLFMPFEALGYFGVRVFFVISGYLITSILLAEMARSGVGRILNNPVVSFFGVLSYSLYLWQQLFLNRTSTSPLCQFPLNLLLALGMAMISYLGVESPLLKLRSRWEKTLFPKPLDGRRTVTPNAASVV